MEKSESIGELAKALAMAQGEIKGAAKDSENPFFKSRYADLASVWEACRASLSKNGLSVIQTTQPTDENGSIPIETMLAHSSGEWISGTLKVLPKADDPQSMGSAITYGRRYALAAMVGVAPDDDDGNAASQGNGQGKIPSRNAPKSNVPQKPNAAEMTELKKALVDVCKMLNKAGDTPKWGEIRLDEFAKQEYGAKADNLEIEPLRELLKKLSIRLDEMKAKPPTEANRTDIERQALIAKIRAKNPEEAIRQQLKEVAKKQERADVPTLESLTLDELIVFIDEIVPF